MVAITLFSYFTWRQTTLFASYGNKLVWFLETAIYAIMVANYARRVDPVAPARGVMEQVFPFLCAALPFGVIVFPYHPVASLALARLGTGLLLVGDALTCVGMATLGRSFSISVEARVAVMHSIYRYVRHPVYLGEIVAVCGVVVWHAAPGAVGVAAAFVLLQTWRAVLEERKLSATFPEYAAYRDRTWP